MADFGLEFAADGFDALVAFLERGFLFGDIRPGSLVSELRCASWKVESETVKGL